MDEPRQTHVDRPIEDYGLLGDTRSAALVGSDGSIDWWCLPRLDSEPVFGRLVGGMEAGTFRMGPKGDATVIDRRYRKNTATIETTWSTSSGELTLTEGMVADVVGKLLPTTLLVRRLSVRGGPTDVVIEFDPRLGEAHRRPRWEHRGDELVCSWKTMALSVSTSPPVPIEPGQTITVRISPERPLTLALAVAVREPLVRLHPDEAWEVLEADERGWQAWCEDVDQQIPWHDAVVRSLLTLRLLTYSPSGAPVAAPTTSLPEEVGGVRNWDYRFAWPRDASIGIGAFLGVGKKSEAHHFLSWLLHASRLDRPHLSVLFTLHGQRPKPEREMRGWPGYAESRPVRVGNGAANQHQLDGYGWVLDAAWTFTNSGHRLSSETWRAMQGFADQVVKRWSKPDAGIWEIRGEEAHHVHSKVMAWLTLDRALRIAHVRRASPRRVKRWSESRDKIASEVVAVGFNEDLCSYTRTYGSTDLDAALLILPQVGLEPANSFRLRGTIDAIRTGLSAGGPLVYRYPPGEDGLPGEEGAFLPCSFWLVQALATTGDQVQARKLFSDLLALASPLGLFSEEMDPTTGAHLGNYPQALTHAGLVNAALSLAEHPQFP